MVRRWKREQSCRVSDGKVTIKCEDKRLSLACNLPLYVLIVFSLSIRRFQASSLLKFEVRRRNKVPAPFQKDRVLGIVEKRASELLSIGKLVHFRYAKAH
jgi:hypothetical protein